MQVPRSISVFGSRDKDIVFAFSGVDYDQDAMTAVILTLPTAINIFGTPYVRGQLFQVLQSYEKKSMAGFYHLRLGCLGWDKYSRNHRGIDGY